MSNLVELFENKYEWTQLEGCEVHGKEIITSISPHPRSKNDLCVTFMAKVGNIWIYKTSGYFAKSYILDNIIKYRKNDWTNWYFDGNIEIGGYYVVKHSL